jgi:hypothetical protein
MKWRMPDLIYKLVNDGHYIITPELIDAHHPIGKTRILKDLGRNLMIFLKQHRDEICIHPVSDGYLEDIKGADRKMGQLSNCRIPPKHRWEIEAVKECFNYLPIHGERTCALRVPYAHHDLPYRVYRAVVIGCTLPKLESQVRQMLVAAEKGLLPRREAVNYLVKIVLSLPPAIDGQAKLCKETIQLQGNLISVVTTDMEHNFRKSRKGAWDFR